MKKTPSIFDISFQFCLGVFPICSRFSSLLAEKSGVPVNIVYTMRRGFYCKPIYLGKVSRILGVSSSAWGSFLSVPVFPHFLSVISSNLHPIFYEVPLLQALSFHLSFSGTPKWDGKERIANLLPRYLGAEKTEYTTQAIKLTMLGAIERVHNPSVKFETSLLKNALIASTVFVLVVASISENSIIQCPWN